MSETRFRRIARLEKLAKPYLELARQTERQWERTLQGTAANAAILAFLIRYGNPNIGEPLSCACQRASGATQSHAAPRFQARPLNSDVEARHRWEFQMNRTTSESSAWKEFCEKFPSALLYQSKKYGFKPHDRSSTMLIGMLLRHAVISDFPGADDKEKLDAVFRSAPPWLIWFTFGDYTAGLLGLTLPDLSSVTGFARSKASFDRWWGLPSDAFERHPWPDGPDNEPLAHTDLNLLRPAKGRPDRQMTPRERRREHAI